MDKRTNKKFDTENLIKVLKNEKYLKLYILKSIKEAKQTNKKINKLVKDVFTK